jgi:hypothetical protein
MNFTKGNVAVMIGAAFLVGCVAGGLFIRSRTAVPGGTEAAPVRGEAPSGRSGPAPARSEAAPLRSVIINGVRLTDADVEALERNFRLQVRDGDYWYDRMNGSWGMRGGPTAGFIMAGLDLGGPLRADASDGNTGVFFNGRQLHQVDVARLSLLGPVYQGRYWMDAMGNIGFEGQPALLNLWAAIQAMGGGGGGQREGILSTYDKTGAAVIGN